MKKRIAWLDFVKLFTIYLVILGHVIAMMENGYVVGEKLNSLIYSFHMPLFMLLSGYFVSSKSGELPLINNTTKKAKLQTILVINIFPDTLAWYVESEWLLDLIIAPLLSLAFLIVCLYLIHLISKNKTLDLIFFGGQYNK